MFEGFHALSMTSFSIPSSPQKHYAGWCLGFITRIFTHNFWRRPLFYSESVKMYLPVFLVPIHFINPAWINGFINFIAPCLVTPNAFHISWGDKLFWSLSNPRSLSCFWLRTIFPAPFPPFKRWILPQTRSRVIGILARAGGLSYYHYAVHPDREEPLCEPCAFYSALPPS
jgi:hypothetical protein